ncbi:MAG: ABC transporter ATP-binding protein [Anaerolineae bacterium]
MSYLSIQALAKRFATAGGVVEALAGFDLEVEQGEFVALLGPSGCGKSTLLRLVAGLERPSAGRVLLDGRLVDGWSAERTLIFQRPNLFPWLSALDNVAFGLEMRGMSRSERRRVALQSLERMGLADVARLYPHEMSGGMQQRVALARALVLNPPVLLMDEPLASLDALLRARLQRELHGYCRGRTVLFVTHDLREALMLADRVVVLSERPGAVRRIVAPAGATPRAAGPLLVALESQITAELLLADDAQAGANAPPWQPGRVSPSA